MQIITYGDQVPYRYNVTEILLDDGTNLSGSSVAVRGPDHLFVGGVFDTAFLVCPRA